MVLRPCNIGGEIAMYSQKYQDYIYIIYYNYASNTSHLRQWCFLNLWWDEKWYDGGNASYECNAMNDKLWPPSPFFRRPQGKEGYGTPFNSSWGTVDLNTALHCRPILCILKGNFYLHYLVAINNSYFVILLLQCTSNLLSTDNLTN